MSKKYKIKKKVASPISENLSDKSAAPKTSSKSLSGATNLILFDKKTKIFLTALLLLYFLLSISKIHTSQIANWDMFFGLPKSESVIAGKPRFIRMDEWMVATPALMGQVERGLPLENKANGDKNTPIVWGMPVKDVSSALRPSVWSYFIFDLEQAFAFSWNFNIFFFFISTFLLFMLITRNNFWLSVFASLFIFLSAGIQWWSYLIGTYMMYLNGMFIAFVYLLYSKKIWHWIACSLILIICIFSFLAYLYPPWQVPLVYLYLFLIIGFLIRKKQFQSIREKWTIKAGVLIVALIILGVIGFHYYQIAKDTYALMLNTVYPGRRFSTGGDLSGGKLFADFFEMFMDDTHVPAKWQNICEASGAIMFFPIVFYGIGYYYYKTKKTDPLLISLSIFMVIGLIYVLIGFPTFLSKITLFSMTPSFRSLPVFAIGNSVLLICYLTSNQTMLKNEKLSWIELAILGSTIFIFIRIVCSNINKATENFFTSNEVNIVTALVLISYLLIRYKNFKFVKPALYVVLLVMTIKQITTNPLTKGLGAVFENPVTQASKTIHESDPGARWALFGDMRLTNLLKANGINVLNGVKYVPALEDMHKLDRSRIYDSSYNRYSWVTMSSHIDGTDTVIFRQTYNDGYTIHIDPCSPRLKQLGVKYFVFTKKPTNEEIRCMIPVKDVAGISIYKIRD